MPARRRALVGDGPLTNFARDLRELQDQTGGRVEWAIRFGASRTAVYAALSGTRLPSTETLDKMISAWVGTEAELRRWRSKRRQTEEALAEASRLRGDVVARRTNDEDLFTARLKQMWSDCGAPSIDDVASRSGLSSRTIDSYLAGRTIPSPIKLEKFFDGLKRLLREQGLSTDIDYALDVEHERLRGEELYRARAARKEERARVRSLARALPSGGAEGSHIGAL